MTTSADFSGSRKLVGINLSPAVIDYFKKLAEDSDIPYQKLIDLYLLDCVKHKRDAFFGYPTRDRVNLARLSQFSGLALSFEELMHEPHPLG